MVGRQKNALTEYHVADPAEDVETAVWLELAKYISAVTDDTDEEAEDTGYYDGDGTPETDVISVKKKYTFEGLHDSSDPAQALIAELELKTGEGRKVLFKTVRTNGKTFVGPATVTDIVVSGGEATEYAPFGCAIGFDKIPTETSTP